MYSDFIRNETNGGFSIAIKSSSVKDLAHLLDPAIPIVHLTQHFPRAESSWWTAKVPLDHRHDCESARIRMLSYDAEFSTPDFLNCLSRFEGAGGADVLQLRKSLPDHLVLRFVDRNHWHEATRDYGMETKYQLPHAGEVAVFWSARREALEHAIAVPVIGDRCITRQ